MAKLHETTKECVKALEECMQKCVLDGFSAKELRKIDNERLEQMKSVLHLIDMFNEVMLEEAKAIDDLSDKMDIIIKKLYEKEQEA